MALTRLFIATVVCLPLAVYLARVVLLGLFSGKVAHTDSSRACRRQSNPVGYWALIALFAAIAGAAIAVWGTIIHEVIAA